MKKRINYSESLSTYKMSLSIIRIIIGLLIVILGFNLSRVIDFLFESDHGIRETLFYYFTSHLIVASKTLTIILALALIIISCLELIFGIALTKKKKWGAWGLFWTTLAWIPLEILFVSRFLVISKTLSIIVNLVMIGLIVNILRNHSEYFR